MKLHETIHEMDTDGNTIGGASVLSIDPESITVTALSGGRNELYGYEPDGDRSSLSILAAAPTSTPYDYYPDSDLVRIAGGTAYRYDENGNLIEKGSEYVETGDEVEIEESGEYRRYEYDLLNRLIAVYVYDEITDEVSLLVEYGYDVNDLRIYRNGSDGISRYVFDVDVNRIEEQRSAGTDYYVFRNGRYLARRSDDGDIVYYGTDQVGTTVLLTDASGDVVWNGEATPFGDQVAEIGPAEGSEALRYQGKEYDPDTGLVYFNARWYDPELGRFITEDPARDGGNWYVFVGNNPLSFVDPSGLYEILHIQDQAIVM